MPQAESALLRAQLRRIWGGVSGLVAVLGLILAGYAAWDYRAQYDQGESEAEEIADMAALNAEGTLLAAEQLLAGLGAVVEHSPAAATPYSPEIRETLLSWRAGMSYLMDLLVIEPPGRIVHWTGPGAPPDVSDREYVRHHLDSGAPGIYIGEPQLSKVHQGAWFFGVSKALRKADGSVDRVVAGAINLEVFGSTLELRFSTPGSSLAIASADGRIYARIPDNVLHVGKKLPIPPEAAAFPSGTRNGVFTTRSPLDGRMRIVAFRQLRGTQLYAIGSVGTYEILAPWRLRLLLVGGLWLVLSAAVLVLAGKLANAAREHDRLAATDSLTGLPNRRSLLGFVDSVERRGGDNGQVVLMIDVDHFKEINDRYGHAVGDDVLRQVAAALRAGCRQSDLVGRYGGEEFLVILDRTSLTDALVLAESMRYSVSTIGSPRGPITVSIGIAEIDLHGGTLDDAIDRADAAMYEAKAAGRNCVRVAGGVPAPVVASSPAP